MGNKFKKEAADGSQLKETIGKGLDNVHAEKAVKARELFVGVRVSEMKKKMFIAACNELEISQSDVFNIAMDEAITKASQL